MESLRDIYRKIQKQRRDYWIFGILLGILVVQFYWMNHYIPLVHDDITYQYYVSNPPSEGPHGTDISRPIQSFSDILSSQTNHYMTEGGRSFIHTIVQVFCGILGKPLYDVAATCIFLLFVLILPLTYKLEKYRQWPVFLMLLLWFAFMFEPKCLYNGISHGVNYLWSTVICFVFLKVFFSRQNDASFLKKIFWAVFACFAGWTHESIVSGIAVGLAVIFLTERRKMTQWQCVDLFFFYLGASILVFAPGNFVRSDRIEYDLITRSSRILIFLYKPLLVYIGFIVYWILKKDFSIKEYVREERFWLCSFIGALLFVFISGIVYPRSMFGCTLFISILILRCFVKTFDSNKLRIISQISSFALIVSGCIILPRQKVVGEQYRWIASALSDVTREPNVELVVPSAHLEEFHLLGKFICGIQFWSCSSWWIQDDFNRRAYKWRYAIKDLKLLDSQFVESLNQCFQPKYKISGNNPFYRLGEVWVARSTLDKSVVVNMHLGDSKIYALERFIRKKAIGLNSNIVNEISIELPVDSFSLQGEMYYFIRESFIQESSSYRNVESIDVL